MLFDQDSLFYLYLSPIFLLFLTVIFSFTIKKATRIRNIVFVSLSFATLIATSLNFYFRFFIFENETSAGFFTDIFSYKLIGFYYLKFSIDDFAMIFALLVSLLFFIATFYVISYLKANDLKHQNRFLGYYSLCILATFLTAFAGNLITMFIFYELLTLFTIPLVAHFTGEKILRALKIYLSYLMITSVFLFLPAIILIRNYAGTNDFADYGFMQFLPENMHLIISIMLFLGIAKAAVFPFHRWLPAAMVAPTPVSALLHAVAVVKTGVFCVLKIAMFGYGHESISSFNLDWLTYLSGFTIIYASMMAISKDSLKARLAFSTISQLSYIVMAVSMLSKIAFVAALFHIIAHAVSKITLFFSAGAIATANKVKKVSQMKGLAKKMPVTMFCFTIGALSMIGIPPTSGFFSKFLIAYTSFEIKNYFVLFVLIISTVLNCIYFLPIIYNAYFEKGNSSLLEKYKEAPKLMQFVLIITASLTILASFLSLLLIS